MTEYLARIISLEEAMEACPDRFETYDGTYAKVDSDASVNADWADDPCEEGDQFLAVYTRMGTLLWLFPYADEPTEVD